MKRREFTYQLVMAEGTPERAVSIIAYDPGTATGLIGVLWDASRREWTSAPAVIADILYDDLDPMPIRPIDRATAEQVARDAFGSELPSEERLLALCEEGERMGWPFGPPPR